MRNIQPIINNNEKKNKNKEKNIYFIFMYRCILFRFLCFLCSVSDDEYKQKKELAFIIKI